MTTTITTWSEIDALWDIVSACESRMWEIESYELGPTCEYVALVERRNETRDIAIAASEAMPPMLCDNASLVWQCPKLEHEIPF